LLWRCGLQRQWQLRCRSEAERGTSSNASEVRVAALAETQTFGARAPSGFL